MKTESTIEVLARGVCVKDGMLLLCHTAGAANTYLPGGHVEFMEGARQSLAREIEEEMGLHCRVGRFLGAVEHAFVQKGEQHCEINLLFELAIDGLATASSPASRERHIDFRWTPLAEIDKVRLEPAVLVPLLPEWLASGSRAERWGSTYGAAGAKG